MPLADENVIRKRISNQNRKQNSIANEVMINGVAYVFEERELPPYFSIMLPKSCKNILPEHANIKYPYSNKPKEILCNEDTTVDIAFDYNDIPTDELECRIKKYVGVIKRLHPSYIFFSKNICKLSSGNEIAWYDFRSPALDGDVYNFNFFMNLRDKELLGWFHSPIEYREQWAPLIREMVQTIRILSPEE